MGRRGFLARLGLGAAGAAACAGGANAKQLVSAIDYAPTFCHMLGIDDQEQMDGRNAWDLVTGKADRLHDRVFTQFGNFAAARNRKWHYFQHQRPGAAPARASMTWKRIRVKRPTPSANTPRWPRKCAVKLLIA